MSDDDRTHDENAMNAQTLLDRQARVDASIAKQLQGSMEYNARMVNRLKKFIAMRGRHFVELESIIRDEEPQWPAE